MINKVDTVGIILNDFKPFHPEEYTGLYTTMIKVKRNSEKVDIIHIVIKENEVPDADWTGREVYVKGILCIHWCPLKQRIPRTMLYVFAEEFGLEHDGISHMYINGNLLIEGEICRPPTFRITPKGRRITELLLAVTSGEKTERITCICWNDNAEIVRDYSVGTRLKIEGRLQSRNYGKTINETPRTLTTWEVSANEIKRIGSIQFESA